MKEYGAPNYPIPKGLINFQSVLKKLMRSQGGSNYQFTDLGKIPVGALSLNLFNQVQKPLLLEELAKLEQAINLAQMATLLTLPERLADLQIYRAQIR